MICFVFFLLPLESSPLTFLIFIILCFGVGLFGFILFGILCASCNWTSVSFFRFGRFSALISSSTFSIPFSLFWIPIMRSAHFTLSYRSLILPPPFFLRATPTAYGSSQARGYFTHVNNKTDCWPTPQPQQRGIQPT